MKKIKKRSGGTELGASENRELIAGGSTIPRH